MEQTTILCYGDSNTYGYDPRGVWGGRYEADSRWCDLLAEATGRTVVNCGVNGRSIPTDDWDWQVLEQAVEENSPVGLLTIMLGTNDMLLGYRIDPSAVAEHMEQLTERIRRRWPALAVLLIAPPPVRIPDPELCAAVDALGPLYEEIARRQGADFCPTKDWGLELAYDGVHLSREGHRTFARQLAAFLEEKKR